nr:MAG TPA: hypothetical protein [Caudoviricetes sp.]
MQLLIYVHRQYNYLLYNLHLTVLIPDSPVEL